MEVRKEKEASVGRDGTTKPTTTEIEANNMTRHSIACNPLPRAAIGVLFPIHHFWIRMYPKKITIIRRKRIIIKGKELLKWSNAELSS